MVLPVWKDLPPEKQEYLILFSKYVCEFTKLYNIY